MPLPNSLRTVGLALGRLVRAPFEARLLLWAAINQSSLAGRSETRPERDRLKSIAAEASARIGMKPPQMFLVEGRGLEVTSIDLLGTRGAITVSAEAAALLSTPQLSALVTRQCLGIKHHDDARTVRKVGWPVLVSGGAILGAAVAPVLPIVSWLGGAFAGAVAAKTAGLDRSSWIAERDLEAAVMVNSPADLAAALDLTNSEGSTLWRRLKFDGGPSLSERLETLQTAACVLPNMKVRLIVDEEVVLDEIGDDDEMPAPAIDEARPQPPASPDPPPRREFPGSGFPFHPG